MRLGVGVYHGDTRGERFLVLPHPEVGEYIKRKTADYDRWLRGMMRLQEAYISPE